MIIQIFQLLMESEEYRKSLPNTNIIKKPQTYA